MMMMNNSSDLRGARSEERGARRENDVHNEEKYHKHGNLPLGIVVKCT